MKMKIPKKCLIPSEKEIRHSAEHKQLVQEANKEIEEYRTKQFNSMIQAKNYIHNYDDLPTAKK